MSWRELVYRLLGFDIELIGHRGSIQPDRGIWTPNDERVYIAMTGWVVNDKVLKLDLNLSAAMLGQRGILLLIGIGTFFPVGLGMLTGIPAAILTLVCIGIILMSVFWSGGLVNMHFPKRYWEFNTIRYREAEVILRQQEDLLDINRRTIELETELAVTKASIPDRVVQEMIPLVDAIEETLLYRKQLQEQKREGKTDDVTPESN